MRIPRTRLSRLELTLVAAALLLPVPLVALDGYAEALPNAVGRSLGSVVTLEADDHRVRVEARGQAGKKEGNGGRPSADSRLTTTRKEAISADSETGPTGSADGEAAPGSTGDESAPTPQEDAPGKTDDTGDSAPPGERGAPSGDGGDSSSTSGDPRGLSLAIGGGGTATGVAAGGDGVTVQLVAETADAGGDATTATVEVSEERGSSTDIRISVPGSGSTIP